MLLLSPSSNSKLHATSSPPASLHRLAPSPSPATPPGRPQSAPFSRSSRKQVVKSMFVSYDTYHKWLLQFCCLKSVAKTVPVMPETCSLEHSSWCSAQELPELHAMSLVGHQLKVFGFAVGLSAGKLRLRQRTFLLWHTLECCLFSAS